MERVTDPSLLEQLEAAAPGEPVDDPELVRVLEGVSPAYSGDEADQRAAALRDKRANNPPPADPSGTGSFADKAIRTAKAGASAASESFTAGGDLGFDGGDPTKITRLVTGIVDGVLRALNATVEGGAAAAGQAAREAGASQGEANRLRRDLIGITEVAALTPSPTRIAKAPGAGAPATAATDGTDAALRAAARLDVEVPKGATGELLPRLAGSIADAPIVGQPLQSAARKATDKLESTASGIADELGGATLQSAGDTVRDELVGWVKNQSKEIAAKLYEPIEKIVGDAKGLPTNLRSATQSLKKQADEAGLKPPKIVADLEAIYTRPDGLSYRGMQTLRTNIGEMLSGDIVPEPGLSKRALKAVYRGLTKDIERLVFNAGGQEGLKAWRETNQRFSAEVSARRDAITKIVGSDGQASAETVASRMITMASDKGGADIQRLSEARKALGDEVWNQLASAALGRMGQTKDGWSLARWRSDYDRLSDEGKKLLFASDDHRQALDDIATVGKQFEALARLGNPSGSARMGLAVGGVGLAVAEPLSLMATALGSYGLARALAKPATAKATADWSNAYANIAGKKLTEETYNRVKRAGLDLRAALDREGIETLIIKPGIIANAPANQEPTSE